MTLSIPSRALALAVVLAAPAAHAADQAGADALQADFQAFFVDLTDTYGLTVAPEDPVHVTVKDGSYLVDIAPLTLSDVFDDEHTAELQIGRTSLRLTPDPDNADLTAYELVTPPQIAFATDGVPVVEFSFASFEAAGRWSDALDTVVSDSTRIEGLTLRSAGGSVLLPPLLAFPSDFTVTVDLLSAEAVALRDRDERWTVRSRTHMEGLVAQMAAFEEGADPVVVRSAAAIDSDVRMTGVPLAGWHDYLMHWLPLVVAAERSGVPLDRDQLIGLVTDLPALFTSASLTTTAVDASQYGLTIARQTDAIEIHTNADGALDLTVHNDVSGLARGPEVQSGPFSIVPEAMDALLPASQVMDMRVTNLPVAQTWEQLIDTVDAWIDDPGAAGEVFLRTFGNRAESAGTSGTLTMATDWDDASLVLDASLAASRQAAIGVSGSVDAVVTNMAYFADTLATSDVPEAASFFILLQALGQQDQPAHGGPLLTHYRIDIGVDGQVTFNTRDFGPVIRMIEGFFGAFDMGTTDLIPDQD